MAKVQQKSEKHCSEFVELTLIIVILLGRGVGLCGKTFIFVSKL